jgi:hypothetical protein
MRCANWDKGSRDVKKSLGLETNRMVWRNLTLIWIALKKCGTMGLGVVYDCQATNRKHGRLPVIHLPLPHSYWLPWDSYMTLSQPKYTKILPQIGGHFLIENHLKQHFLSKNV